jgi:hypothetical protein
MDQYRAYWKRRIRGFNTDFSASRIIERLGLKRKHPDGSRQITFENDRVTELSAAIGAIMKRLPQDEVRLVDVAVDPSSLSADVEKVLAEFGETIWGTSKPGDWLLKASDGILNYPRDLVCTNEMIDMCKSIHTEGVEYIRANVRQAQGTPTPLDSY